jgi:hypothetical protein
MPENLRKETATNGKIIESTERRQKITKSGIRG